MLLHFSSLDLCGPILDAIAHAGYDTPTPIQAQAIPPVLAGRDLLEIDGGLEAPNLALGIEDL